MDRWKACIVGLAGVLALTASPAAARPAHAHAGRGCCLVKAGTVVSVELADEVSTQVQKPGDKVAFRLSAPLIVDGRVVLRSGTPGVGEVIESSRPGLGGKPAELVLAARYLMRRGGRVRLEGLKLASAGHDNSRAARIVGLAGYIAFPLGYAGLAIKGDDVTFDKGATASAKLADDVFLPSLGPAPPDAEPSDAALVRAVNEDGPVMAGPTAIAPPPPGQGQVIFFRKHALTSIGQWFRVREGGKAIGKLGNGSYFVQNTKPGVHTYSATFEPEFKDKLRLEVDPGETYFVQGTTTVALVVGAADLSPSDRAAFEAAAKHFKSATKMAKNETAKGEGAPSAVPSSGASAAASAAEASHP
ncbi:MAG TPA: hypothetical protein VHY32_06320 [Caulobacteraceae bacterium]|jgi:hypothetical protein|nr:hypothetical protein [Caulobacteraceae bacterium]